MHIDVLGLIGAAAGGLLGATFGALVAFVFTGFAVVAGVAIVAAGGSPDFLNDIAYGAFFGPHISFAAGVGAAAYAARRGYLATGRDIVTPLVSLAKADVLLVGAAFGIFGYIVQVLIAAIPGFGATTNSIALTVVISAIVARYAFGRTGLIGKHSEGFTGRKRFSPNAEHVWIAYQQSPTMASLLGLFVGGISAWASVTLLHAYPNAPGVVNLGFGISAISLICLGFGLGVPATHHITLIPAVFVGSFMAAIGNDTVTVLIAALLGAVTGLLGEFFSRLWLIRGDTHIDPPASSIWPMTSVVLISAAILVH